MTKEQTGRPQIGEPITDRRGTIIGQVTSIDGNICHIAGVGNSTSFIWNFRDGLNALHHWPSKAGKVAFCPGEKPVWEA